MLKTVSLSVVPALFAALFLFAPVPAQAQAKPLKNVQVTGVASRVVGGVTETFDFVGKVTIESLALVDEDLMANGVVKGVVDGQHVTQSFSVPLLLSPNDPGVCDILFLELGPIDLNLLGLQLDLSQIVLDLDAIPGPGALLGNLLCALTGLLDGGLLGDILGEVLDLIDAINALL